MSWRDKLGFLAKLGALHARQPGLSRRLLANLLAAARGFNHAARWRNLRDGESAARPPVSGNRLAEFAAARESGRGIWKWNHYFDIYQRHFGKFVGQEVHVLEVGVYSGGSLEMWRDYFGPKCRVYGFDVEPACRSYRNEYTEIFIGDQADRGAWKKFREQFPTIDILIDDGGHDAEQQIVTLEEMLPHLRPGGVFLCEDVYGEHNGFSAYLQGLVDNLHSMGGGGWKACVDTNGFQRWIRSAHTYPYVTVLEKADAPLAQLVTEKRGTEWQPFL